MRTMTVRRNPAPAADVVLYAEPSDLAESASPRRSNPPKKGAVRRSKWQFGEEGLSLYDGHEKLLVRTALIRAVGYTSKHDLPNIRSSREVSKLCAHLTTADQEHLVVISINTRGKANAIFEVATGGTSSANAEMPHILKVPLLTGAVGVIIVHNHPAGDSTPSTADIDFTEAVSKALKCVGIPLFDHVIVAQDGHFSFVDSGILPTNS